MFVLKGPEEQILALRFAPDSTTLYATHAADVGVRAWNLADHTSRMVKFENKSVYGEFVLHPGGRWAFVCRRGEFSGNARALDLDTGSAKPVNFVNPWGHVAVSSDGTRLATIGTANGPAKGGASVYALCGFTMTAAGPRPEWELRSPADALAWVVAFVGNDTLVTEDKLPEVYSAKHKGVRPAFRLAVRSATTGQVTTVLDSPYDGWDSRHLFASPDGAQFVAQRGLTLHVWDVTDWEKPPLVVPGKDDARVNIQRAAAFHPTQPYLLLANDGPSVLVFDTSTWKQVRRWNWKAGTMRAVAVSPDGALAAAAGPRGAIVVWDLDL